MQYSEENLRNYVEKCFIDAFNAEYREYNKSRWNFEWVMIKNRLGLYQLYPRLWCKYVRILRRVRYRLEHNLMKNFGIHYSDTDEMRCVFYDSGAIDPNYTQFMFKTDRGNVSLSVFDGWSMYAGECMTAYRYEKLVFQYWGLNAASYKALPKNDERRHLPDFLRKDWDAFKDLYLKTFGETIGKYDIICSAGIQAI